MNTASIPLPGFIQIEPVGQCNLACRMCPVQFRADGHSRRVSTMPLPRFRQLLAQFPDATELHLQGIGEPLMHPRLFDMVRLAVSRGLRVSTNSNMTLMSERRARDCVDSGLARMHVSIDAATPARYEWIRVGARFGRAVRGIERLQAAKARSGALLPHLELVAVLMRENIDEIASLVELAARLDIPAVSVQQLAHDCNEENLPARYAPMREFVAAQAPDVGDAPALARSFQAAHTAAARHGVDLRLPRLALAGARRGCDWPWRGAYLSYRGEAMPCCMVATPDRVSFGNMAISGVQAIWENPAYSEFRARLESEEPPEICRGCAVYAGRF